MARLFEARSARIRSTRSDKAELVLTECVVKREARPSERDTQGRSRELRSGQSVGCRRPSGLVCTGWKSAEETQEWQQR
jgi:hypothetical protein